jgi:soluble lytic murein transglycosylase-like protein
MNKLMIAVTATAMLFAAGGVVRAQDGGETLVDMMSTGSISDGNLADADAPDFSDSPYTSLITRYAKKYGVPVSLAHAVVRVESNFNPKARGSAGEIGLMQIKPATARMMGYKGSSKGLYNPETNLNFGMKYLAMAQDLGDGKTCSTILKYNAGHAAKRMNPVSKRYCGKVLALLD